MSHLGRPKGKVNPDFSLKHIVDPSQNSGHRSSVCFCCVSQEAKEKAVALKQGEVLLLENLRFHPEEEGKPKIPEGASDEEIKALKAEMKEKQKVFAQNLSKLADVYVTMHLEQHPCSRIYSFNC